jgi:hypothetical protein
LRIGVRSYGRCSERSAPRERRFGRRDDASDRPGLIDKNGGSMKKRFASVLTVVAALAATGAGTAGAHDTNVAVQSANIGQSSFAASSATQFAGPALVNLNASSASAANYASIVQLLSQSN